MINIVEKFLSEPEQQELLADIERIKTSSCSEITSKSKYFLICDQRRKILNHIKQFSGFSSYLKKVMNPKYNVVLHNIMFLESNTHGVRRHVNSTIADMLRQSDHHELAAKYPAPDFQTVFYMGIPDDLQGGVLTIHDDESVTIPPVDNKLIEFSGGLEHEVSGIQTSGVRVTLFTEQYNFEVKDIILARDTFMDNGTMYNISRVTEPDADDVSVGEFLMPYDE